MTERLTERIAELVAGRVAFVHATVVRAQCPTSACPGDSAIVFADGTLEGFVGGQCAEGSVRTAAIGVLASGEPLLLRVLPDGDLSFPESPGAVTVVNPCLSGGALEIFLEPCLPAAVLCVAGVSPIARAIETLARSLGFDVQSDATGDLRFDGAIAVIIATHGRSEDDVIHRALDAGVPFVGLVASHARGAAVLDVMGLDRDQRARVRTPVGVDIGARTAQEVALSIVADVVRAIRVDGIEPAPGKSSPPMPVSVDPVCGMTVTVVDGTPYLEVDGQRHWFCGPGCRDRFALSTSRSSPTATG